MARLARRLGRRYAGLCSEDDLAAAGALALAQAARTFDASLGVTFEVFAWSRVHGAMIKTARREDAHARAAREGAYRLAELARDEADPWSDGDAEHRDHLDAFAGALVASMLAGVVSEASEASAGGSEEQLVARETYGRALAALTGAVGALPEPDPDLIRLVYREERTLKDSGAALGMSYASVRRAHQRALERLSARLRGAGVTGSPAQPPGMKGP